MGIVEQIKQENANYDPHGFKSKGTGIDKVSAFEDPKIPHQEFPKAIYKVVGKETESKVVGNADELAKAKSQGWHEGVTPPTPAPAPNPALIAQQQAAAAAAKAAADKAAAEAKAKQAAAAAAV